MYVYVVVYFFLFMFEWRPKGVVVVVAMYTTGKLSRRNLFGMSHFLLKIPPTAEPGGLKELRHDVTMYVCNFVSVVQNYSNQNYSKFCYLICLMCFTNWKHLSHEFYIGTNGVPEINRKTYLSSVSKTGIQIHHYS